MTATTIERVTTTQDLQQAAAGLTEIALQLTADPTADLSREFWWNVAKALHFEQERLRLDGNKSKAATVDALLAIIDSRLTVDCV